MKWQLVRFVIRRSFHISKFFRFVSSPEEVLEVIEEGKSNRHIAVTSKLDRFADYKIFWLKTTYWQVIDTVTRV